MNNDSSSPATLPPLLTLICKALDDKKAGDLRLLDVSEQSSITDFLILATGTSEPHLRALRVELEKVIDATGTKILGMDKGLESGWLVVDAFDIMIHVFTPENRKKYALENLWRDAIEISVPELLNPPATKPKKPASAKTKAAKTAGAKKAPAKKKTAAKKATKPASKKTAPKKK